MLKTQYEREGTVLSDVKFAKTYKWSPVNNPENAILGDGVSPETLKFMNIQLDTLENSTWEQCLRGCFLGMLLMALGVVHD